MAVKFDQVYTRIPRTIQEYESIFFTRRCQPSNKMLNENVRKTIEVSYSFELRISAHAKRIPNVSQEAGDPFATDLDMAQSLLC